MERKEAIAVLECLALEMNAILAGIPKSEAAADQIKRCIDAYDMAISAIRQQDVTDTNVGKWISVKDRLPEAGGYVVCIAKRNPFSRFMPMVARIEKNGWANPITEQYISEVTHWMPLPEPPEEPY